MNLFNLVTNLFRKKLKFKQFPKNTSWMINQDLTPNIKNLRKCEQFNALVGVKQNSEFHKEGDVWKHTMNVANEMFKLISDSTCLLDYRDKYILMVAAICHDLGKATTTYLDKKEQQWRCVNHGYAGEKITRDLIFDQDINTREEICWLVRWHMNLHYITQKNINEQTREVIKLSNGFSTIEKLIYLNLADSIGSKTDRQDDFKIKDRLKKIANIAMENDCYRKPFTKEYCHTDCNMYVMIGLPGSGKDTYIEKFLRNIPCICRDDIREEAKDGRVIGRKLLLDNEGELAVTKTVNERIKNCCVRKRDFVVNQTSLKRKYRLHLKELASKYANVNVIYIYVEAPSIQDCINRRGGGKWDLIINKMWSDIEFPDKSECDELILYKES